MRTLLLIFIVVTFSTNTICAQNTSEKVTKWNEDIVSYKYDKYGVINQYTNGMVLEVNDKLSISKKKYLFSIQISDPISGNVPIYSLINISSNGYDELNEMYIYIGDAIEIKSKNGDGLIYKGKCLITSYNELSIYLNNEGYNYEHTYNNELSFSVYFRNMQTTQDGYIPRIPNSSIKIFPIKNK